YPLSLPTLFRSRHARCASLGGGGGQETNVRAEAPRAERSAPGRARQSAHALRRHRAGFLGAVARLRERRARGLRRLRGAFAGLRRLGVFRVHRAHRRGVLVSRLGILPIVPRKANGRNRGESRSNVLPERAPLRQFVLTLPFELRARLAYDGKLLGAVCHAFVDSVLGWYRRHLSARGLSAGKGGAVTAVQRVSSDLRLNPHFHSIALDGVYVEDEHSELAFHRLPCLTNGDVAD